jgi:hypothetical protein
MVGSRAMMKNLAVEILVVATHVSLLAIASLLAIVNLQLRAMRLVQKSTAMVSTSAHRVNATEPAMAANHLPQISTCC